MTHGGNPSWEMKPGTVLGGDRFLLIEPLGQGGMGVVWLAHDQRLDEDVALKLVPPEIRTDAGALEDLRRETLRSRKLSHPNIIRLHDLNEFSGEPPFISMEFVDGQTVAAWKSQQPQRLFTWEQLRPLAKQLCDALDYAHGEKVVHRDLKPANMMLDRRGRLKLADFGLAAVVSELTSRVSIKANTSGTPAYMSPQQMDGRTPRVTDDIYALGATLYELLTSKPPFYHGDIPHQVRNLPPDPVDQRLAELELSNQVPPFVGALIMACLAKDPAQRPQSAAAVAEWLQLGGQSVASALASEITQRSVPSAPSTPASSLTPVPVAIPIPAAEAPAESSPPSKKQKWSWKKRAAVFLGVWLVLGIIGNAAKRRQTGGEANSHAGGQSAASRPEAPAGRQTLFNGRNLDNWDKLGPHAWRVEDGVIKATTRTVGRSYIIWPQRVTGNFELSFDYKPSSQRPGNGHHGVFYRATMPLGSEPASGLAMPLDAGNYGALLFRGTGDFIPDNPQRAQQLRPDEWNQIRIRVEGTRIIQSINGVVAYNKERADLFNQSLGDSIAFEIWVDDTSGERSLEMRNIELQVHRGGAAAAAPAASPPDNRMVPVFNGSDTSRLRGYKQPDFPTGSWVVEDGQLKVVPGSAQVDLVLREEYTDFELEMLYRVGAGGASGIIYRAQESGDQAWHTGAEMQLADDAAFRMNPEANTSTGALFKLISPSPAKSLRPAGQDNLAKVRVSQGKVEHWLNNTKILEYEWNSPALQQAIRRNFRAQPDLMKAERGLIVIQHQGSEFSIVRMQIRRL